MTAITALVKAGPFFFKDASHWLYSSKKTELLEDLVRYEKIMTDDLDEVIDIVIQNAGDTTAPFGYGSSYGTEYGGIYVSDSNVLTLKPVTGSGKNASLVSTTSYADISGWFKVISPVRDLTAMDATTLTLSFTHPDSTANSFGLEEDLPFSVIVANQPAEGTAVPSSKYSFIGETISSVGLATIQAAHASSNPIQIEVDSSLLDFASNTDIGFIEFDPTVLNLPTQTDLPAAASASPFIAYYITEPTDGNYQKYMIVDEAKTSFNVFDTLPRTSTFKFAVRLVEDPGNPGNMTDGQFLWCEPLDWANGAFFAAGTEDTEVAQMAFDRFDGLPQGVKLTVNSFDLQISSHTDEILTMSLSGVDDWTTVAGTVGADYAPLLAGIDLTNGVPTVTLNGTGRDYIASYKVFFHEMEKRVSLGSDYKSHGPVVITDLLATEIDDPSTLGYQFRVEDTNLVFNKPTNLLANPSFFVHDSGAQIPGWQSFSAGIVRGENGLTSWIHEKAVRLNLNEVSVLRQHVGGIDPGNFYTLSLYAKSDDSVLGVRIYGFTNGTLTSFPDLSSAAQTIEFNTVTLTNMWERYAARVKNIQGLSETLETKFSAIDGDIGLDDGITDIVIEIYKAGGSNDAIIDAVQLEVGTNPGDFSTEYNLGVVEYESDDERYFPRMRVSGTDTSDNVGFLTLSIEDNDILGTRTPSENLLLTTRNEIKNDMRANPWALTEDPLRWVQTARFTSDRSEEKGVFFLYPDITEARYISFLGSPLQTSMKTLETPTEDDIFRVVVEDDQNRNLSSRDVELTFGTVENDFTSLVSTETTELGTAQFTVPDIYMETACPILRAGIGPNQDMTFGHEVAYKGTDRYEITTTTLNITDRIRFFTESGLYSKLYQPANISSGEFDIVEDTATFDFEQEPSSGYADPVDCRYGMVIPAYSGVPTGYVLLTDSLLYDASLNNNANGVITYVSGINNMEIQHRCYGKDQTERVVTKSYAGIEQDGVVVANLGQFNAVQDTVQVIDQDFPEKLLRQSASDTPIDGTFFIDYDDSKLKIYDPRVKDVNVKYTLHPFYVNPNDRRSIYVHNTVLMNIVRNISRGIENSDLKDQHDEDFGSFTASPLKAMESPIALRVYFYPQQYVTAQHRDRLTSTTITYRHPKPIL